METSSSAGCVNFTNLESWNCTLQGAGSDLGTEADAYDERRTTRSNAVNHFIF